MIPRRLPALIVAIARQISRRALALRAAKGTEDAFASGLQKIADDDNKSEKDVAAAILALLLLYAEKAYQDGMREGGVDDPGGDMSDEDRAAIESWTATQSAFVGGLAAAIVAARSADDREKERSKIAERIALWVGSLLAIRLLGLSGARGDMMVTWRYGDTDHCDTCLDLHGQRRRLSWFASRGYIPREPGSKTLDCKGYRCQCGLYDDFGKRVM